MPVEIERGSCQRSWRAIPIFHKSSAFSQIGFDLEHSLLYFAGWSGISKMPINYAAGYIVGGKRQVSIQECSIALDLVGTFLLIAVFVFEH